MIERLMLDTNVIIYSLGGNISITKLITNKEHFISEITEIELLGFHKLSKEDEIILTAYLKNAFIIQKIVLYFTPISQSSISLKQKHC